MDRQIMLVHTDHVVALVCKGINRSLHHIIRLDNGRGFLCKDNRQVTEKMSRCQCQRNAAGFNSQYLCGVIITEVIRQHLTHTEQQTGFNTVVQKHIHFDNIGSGSTPKRFNGLPQFLHILILHFLSAPRIHLRV